MPSPGKMERVKIGSWTKRRASRKGAGKKKKRDKEKQGDVNRKILEKEVKHCLHRTTNYGGSLLYETCYTNIR